MPDIFTIGYIAAGIGIGYVLMLLDQRRNKGLSLLIKAIKKRKPIIWLETDKSVYFRVLARSFRNLGITPEKEVIIIPKSTVKPCLNLGGVEMVHADLYKSIGTPREFRLFINELTEKGWREEEIAKFFEEIEVMPPEVLPKFWSDMDKETEKIRNEETGDKAEVKNGKKEDTITGRIKLVLYKNLPSVVKDFIYTGINRVTIHSMIREMVYQRELENVKPQRNWVAIAIAIFIIIIAVAVLLRFAFGGSTSIFGSLVGLNPAVPTPTPPATIAP